MHQVSRAESSKKNKRKESNKSPRPHRVLIVEVVEGKEIAPNNPGEENLFDPYVIVSVGKEKFKTKVIRDTINPVWDIGTMRECFVFKSKHWYGKDEIVLKCMDWDRFKSEDRLGMVTVPIKHLEDGRSEIDNWFPLKPQKPGDIASGQLHIRVKISNGRGSDDFRASQLWKAIRRGDNELVERLLAQPTGINLNEKDHNGETLLHLAAKNSKSSGIFEVLLDQNISITATDNEGNSPLHTFCRHFAYPSDFLYRFISKGAHINAQNKYGETPLHHVVFNPSVKLIMAQQLLKNNGDVNITTVNKDTPLHYAIETGRADLVKLFIAHGADCNLVGSKGKVPISLARQLGISKLAEQIIDSLNLLHCLQKLNLEHRLYDFLDQEIYLYHLEDIPDHLLLKLVDSKEGMDKLRELASKQKALNRKETFMRKQETEFRKREELRKKESNVRKIIAQALPTNTNINWEIDLSDLEFVQGLGHGASGDVYKGFYQATIPVAIKVLKAAEADWQKEVDEFIKEFRIALNVSSQHIVRFYGATLKHRLCLVMEFCEKGSLFAVLSKDKDLCLTWDLVFSMLEETVSGIVALHTHDPPIFHRDLKTLNVLVTADYKCKVCDFGLSRYSTPSNKGTLLKCRGTLAYIAKEVYAQQGFFPQSDVYSIAFMMWEVVNRAVTGQYIRPFHDIKVEFSILMQAHQKNRRPLIPENVPASLKELITRSWDGEYQKRPNAKTLLDELIVIRQEYEKNRDEWDKICHYTSTNSNNTERPRIRRGGGGSVQASTLSLIENPL